MRHRPIAAFASAAIILASCSSDDGNGATSPPATVVAPVTVVETVPATEPPPLDTVAPETTDAATTTIDPVAEIAPYATPGPHPVGATTLQLAKGPSVEVWYPAVEGTTGTVTYDVRDFVPEAISTILTGDVAATFSFPGGRDVEAATGGPFPVVLFSHGFTGMRLQSSFLTSHLASYGMIVVAPDHPSRDLTNVLGATASGDRDDAIDDLLQSLDLILAENQIEGGRFEGRVDAERVAALGHSAGGGTILGASMDERVDGFVSMASGGPGETGEFPPVPSFFLAGATDEVISATRTRAAFDLAPTPTWYWELDATGHNGFDDFCTFGGGTGIIGLAEASGLGGLLDAQPQLRALGEDGCVPPAVPVEQVFPTIRHGVTAWMRWLFGIDAEPVGVGDEINDAADVDIVAEQR